MRRSKNLSLLVPHKQLFDLNCAPARCTLFPYQSVVPVNTNQCIYDTGTISIARGFFASRWLLGSLRLAVSRESS